MSERSDNPYAAPVAVGQDSDSHESSAVPWLRWLGVACFAEFLLTLFVLSNDSRRLINVPAGVAGAVISGFCLLMSSLFISRRYRLPQGLLLAQLLNLTVWLTMLATVWFFLPQIMPNQTLTGRDCEIFVIIWGSCGGVLLLIVPLLSLLMRRSDRQMNS